MSNIHTLRCKDFHEKEHFVKGEREWICSLCFPDEMCVLCKKEMGIDKCKSDDCNNKLGENCMNIVKLDVYSFCRQECKDTFVESFYQCIRCHQKNFGWKDGFNFCNNCHSLEEDGSLSVKCLNCDKKFSVELDDDINDNLGKLLCSNKCREIKRKVLCIVCRNENKQGLVFCNYCGLGLCNEHKNEVLEHQKECKNKRDSIVSFCEKCGDKLVDGCNSKKFCKICTKDKCVECEDDDDERIWTCEECGIGYCKYCIKFCTHKKTCLEKDYGKCEFCNRRICAKCKVYDPFVNEIRSKLQKIDDMLYRGYFIHRGNRGIYKFPIRHRSSCIKCSEKHMKLTEEYKTQQLKDRIKQLEGEIEHLKTQLVYQPGGPGFEKAKTDYENRQKN